MKSLCVSFIILSSFATLFTVTEAWRFNVGGNGVWSLNPQENYKTWAERNRFQVNDTLYFKYPKGSDSVQRVMKVDFNGCNVGNPLDNFVNGESVVTLNRSGSFYFISGNQDHCMKGQKLNVVVLAVRNHTMVPISPAKPPAKPPSTARPPSSPSPASHIAPAKSPSMSQPPKSSSSPKSSDSPKSSSPESHSPLHAPAKSPATLSPVSHSPSHAPTKSPATPSPVSHSPSHAPTHSHATPSPVSHKPSHAPTKSPVSPSPSPKSSSPPSPSPTPSSSPDEQTPTTSPSASETTPSSDKITAPAPSPKNSASGVAFTSAMTTVLSAVLTVLMIA